MWFYNDEDDLEEILLQQYEEKATPPLKEKILVAGGAGFMGSWIAERLVKDGHEVLVIDNFSTGRFRNIPDGADHIALDCRDTDSVHNAMRVFRPDVVYNLAAFAREGSSVFSPKACIQNNVDTHVNLLTEAIRSPNFRKVVFFSSMAVYGDLTPPFSEAMPPAPCDPYGSSKLMCEEVTKSLAKVHDFQWTIVRPHNVFGERQSLSDRQRNVVAIFMNSILRHEPLTIYGKGGQTRAFSYIHNSLPVYTTLRSKGDKQIYNVGDSKPITIADVAKIVNLQMSYLGCKKAKITNLPDRPLEVKHAHTTFEKQMSVGYDKRYTFEEGVTNMAKWAKTQGAQPWLNVPVELPHKTMPETWR